MEPLNPLEAPPMAPLYPLELPPLKELKALPPALPPERAAIAGLTNAKACEGIGAVRQKEWNMQPALGTARLSSTANLANCVT